MSRRTHARRVLRTCVVAVASCATGAGTSAGWPAAPPVTAAAVQPLGIVTQDFELAAQDTFDVTLALPAGLDAATIGTDGERAEVRVRAHAALLERRDIAQIRDGRGDVLGDVEDTFVVDLAPEAADPHLVARTAPDQLALAVPVEAVESDLGLELPREGVYPIAVELRVGGQVVAETTTFVHRRSAGESTIGDLPVGVLMAQTVAPTVTADGSLELSPGELADLTTLTESLEALDAAAVQVAEAQATEGQPIEVRTIPRAVQVEPASLQALEALEPELATRLVTVLSRSSVVATPKLPLDPSSIVAVEPGPRDRIYTEWLRTGEDIVTAAVPGIRTDRSLYIADGPISDAGVIYLAGTGVDAIVMSPELYDSTTGNIQDYGDPTWLQTIELTDGSTLAALRIDPSIGARLDQRAAQPVQAAVDLLAEVLTYRQYLDEIGRSVPRSGLLLAASDSSAFDPALAAEIGRLLLQIDGIDLVTPPDLVTSMDNQLVDGTLGTLSMPERAGEDLTERFRTIDAVTFEAAAIGTMLPAGDGHTTQWAALIDTMPSSGLTDAEVAQMTAALQAGFGEFRNGVRGPDPFSFTMTGRTGTIRFRIHNTTDVPLTVMVRLEGAKVTFPVNDVLYTIPPQGHETVVAEAESRSNGTSQVIVRILTPTGAQIVPDVVLTAQVRAFTGLGQLITGACLLVLLTWWVRHWRLSRRRDAAAATSDRHPTVRGRKHPHIADDPAADPAGDGVDGEPDADGAGEGAAAGETDPSGTRPADTAATSLPPS